MAGKNGERREEFKEVPLMVRDIGFKNMIERSIKSIFRRHWPQWESLRDREKLAKFTIKMDKCYRYYNFDEDLDEEFQSASKDMLQLQSGMSTLNPTQDRAFERCLAEDLITVIFGSNNIERVGANLDVTIKLCEGVFQGEGLQVEARSEQYEDRLKGTIQSTEPGKLVKVRQQRQEVVQHAKALSYITTSLITNNEPLTENLLLRTHKILCEGLPLDDGGPQVGYAGIYRTQEVTAGFSTFSSPSNIPHHMSSLIAEFASDINKAESGQELDPFFLVAKYCHKFVMIHPFLDGNGRVCRLLLNAILLKYAGIVVPLGENDESRERYLGITANSAIAGEEDETPWAELASLVLVKASVTLRKWKERVCESPSAKS